MTVNTFEDDVDDESGTDRRKLIIGGGVGAVALIAVAALAFSGGGGGDNTENSAIPRGHPRGGGTLPSPSAAPASPEAALATTNVASVDPFQVPTRILQALVPPAQAPAAAPAATTTTVAAGAGGTTGSTGAATGGTPGTTTVGTTGTTGATGPTSTSGTTGTTGTASGTSASSVRPSVQFVQLLGAKQNASGWKVTVRTNHGTCTGIKEGTAKVCGTDFSFVGEDESLGKSTFVFVFGEVQGGNLRPDAAQKPKPVKAGPNALVAVNGKVDGGLTADS